MKELDPYAEQIIKAQERTIRKYQKEIDVQNQLINTQQEMLDLMEAHIQKLNDLIDQFPR